MKNAIHTRVGEGFEKTIFLEDGIMIPQNSIVEYSASPLSASTSVH